jgi:hypothetical protein
MKNLVSLSLIICMSVLFVNTTKATSILPDRLAKIIKLEGLENVEHALNSAQLHPTNQLELGILFFKMAEEKRNKQDQNWQEDLKKAYTILSILSNAPELEEELIPYIRSYHAASMAWLGATTYHTRLVAAAWQKFDQLEKEYGENMLIVDLLKAKTAAELPYFHNRKPFARKLVNKMIENYESGDKAENPLLISQVYRLWVKLYPKADAQDYLDKADLLEKQAV